MEYFELDVSNYRGSLQAGEENGKYYWRVDCDVHDEKWIEIPKSLYEELVKQEQKESEANDEYLYRVSLDDSRNDD